MVECPGCNFGSVYADNSVETNIYYTLTIHQTGNGKCKEVPSASETPEAPEFDCVQDETCKATISVNVETDSSWPGGITVYSTRLGGNTYTLSLSAGVNFVEVQEPITVAGACSPNPSAGDTGGGNILQFTLKNSTGVTIQSAVVMITCDFCGEQA